MSWRTSTPLFQMFSIEALLRKLDGQQRSAVWHLCCTWTRHAEGSGNTAVCDFLCHCRDVCGSRDSHTKLACSFVLHLCLYLPPPPCVSLKSVCVTCCGLNNNVKPEQHFYSCYWFTDNNFFFYRTSTFISILTNTEHLIRQLHFIELFFLFYHRSSACFSSFTAVQTQI